MEWQDRPVLVTGGGGFIGSHLVEELAKRRARVRAFVRYNSRGTRGFLDDLAPQVAEQVEVVAGDLRDANAVASAVEGMATVFHLGALIAIPYSYLHPREVVETNVLGTLNVLAAARQHGVQRVVHTSTSEVYGTAQYVPIDEKHPMVGQSPYSASKIAADQLAESFHRSYELPVVTVRPFNTYGPRQSARAVIPSIIVQAITQDRIFLGATHPTRDLLFVKDTVRGFLALAACDAAVGQVVNLGSGREVSVRELSETIIRLVGRRVEIVFDATRLRPERSEVERLVADHSRARELAGWEPTVNLEEGLRATIDWISSHAALYRPREYAV
jgi:NAD dependent epimerase/dehydratase